MFFQKNTAQTAVLVPNKIIEESRNKARYFKSMYFYFLELTLQNLQIKVQGIWMIFNKLSDYNLIKTMIWIVKFETYCFKD